jgi:DNA primase large subunit
MIDIAIYYKTRFRKSIDLAKEISEVLNKGKLKGLNIQILRLPEENRETLTEYLASTLRIPAVQIEIARYLRDDARLREEIVANLSDLIK